MHIVDPVADLIQEGRLSGVGTGVGFEHEHRCLETIRGRVFRHLCYLGAWATVKLDAREPVLFRSSAMFSIETELRGPECMQYLAYEVNVAA